MIDNIPVGFIAVLHFPHPSTKNLKRVHRLVILPDYQGVGIGNRLLEFIGKYYRKNGKRFFIVTSTPSLLNYFSKSDKWRLKRQGRVGSVGRTGSAKHSSFIDYITSGNRLTTSWEMI